MEQKHINLNKNYNFNNQNYPFKKNNIFNRFHKYNSPTSIFNNSCRNPKTKELKQEILSNDINEIYNNHFYKNDSNLYNSNNDIKMFYNDFYNRINNNSNFINNNYNSIKIINV